MKNTSLGKIPRPQITGNERFHNNGHSYEFSVYDFWRWSSSDLLSNAMRGIVAEYLVACDLGVAHDIREEWNPYDLRTPQGWKIEVKSAAYLQSWAQKRLSTISFGIKNTLGWDSETATRTIEPKRQADVYVFALLHHQDKATVDPLNLAQWTFYVLPTAKLNDIVSKQKNIGLRTLLRLDPVQAKFGEIAISIEKVMSKIP